MLNSVTKKVAEDDIQLKLNKTATRKNLITKVLPFTGLIFLILLFSLTTDGKFLDDMKVEDVAGWINKKITPIGGTGGEFARALIGMTEN